MSDVVSKRLDPQQRDAVFADSNIVVAAGAGSGKTTVLSERYLRIIAEGRADVSRILTLTFTRKAAAEMHARIYRRLLAARGDPEVDRALPDFDHAQISTLDSFCAQIARIGCARFGISPDFDTDERRVRELVEDTALAFLMGHQENDGIRRLISENGFESTWKECFGELAMEHLHVCRALDFEALYEAQRNALRSALSATAGRLNAVVGRYVGSVAGPGSGAPPGSGSSKTEQAFYAAVFALGDWEELFAAGRFDEIVAQADALRSVRKPGRVKNPDLIALAEGLDEIRTIVADALEIVGTAALEPAIHEIFRAFEEFQQDVLERRRSSGALTFQDVVEMAVVILRDDIELRNHYKGRFRYIMIDEFQDNNSLQRDLLFLLAERMDAGIAGRFPAPAELDTGKLFFVGDEKQSIYLFRGADVSVFKRLADDLAATGGTGHALDSNYRSDPRLISFFNELFPRVMAGSTEDYEATFRPLESGLNPAMHTPSTAGPLVRLFHKPFRPGAAEQRASGEGTSEEAEAEDSDPWDEPTADAGSILAADDAEAYRIARFVYESVEGSSPMQLPGEHGPRPARYEDFALLLRSGSNQIRYERMFRLFNLPYTSESVRSLFLEAPLNDLYSALQLAVYPYDRVAYAALLRGPFVNVSDEALVEILASDEAAAEGPGAQAAADGPPRRMPFSETGLALDEQDRLKFERGAGMYRDLLESIDRVPIDALLRKLWYDYGYRFVLLRNPSYHTYLEYFEYFVELARVSQVTTVAGFLDVVRPHLGRYEKLPELSVMRERTSGIQIMTIHKSKGLEFPVVILANLGNVGRREGAGTVPFYVHPELGPTFNLIADDGNLSSRTRVNYFYAIGTRDRNAREQAELKRLLYVGMTRAQSLLVLSGVHHRNNQNTPDAMLNMILDTISEAGNALDNLIEREEIPDVSEQEVANVRQFPPHADLQAMSDFYTGTPVVDRHFPRRRWTATELNRESSEPGAARTGAVRGEAAARSEDAARGEGAEPLPKLNCDEILEREGLETIFGTLCHRLIEGSLRGRYRNPAAAGLQDLARELHLAVDPDAADVVLKDAVRLASAFLDSAPAAVIRADGAKIESELPFILRTTVGGVDSTVRGQIDLLVERPNEVVVIDFKTDKAIREGEYDVQLGLYREAALHLIAGADRTGDVEPRSVRSALCYLRGPKFVWS